MVGALLLLELHLDLSDLLWCWHFWKIVEGTTGFFVVVGAVAVGAA